MAKAAHDTNIAQFAFIASAFIRVYLRRC